MSGANDKKGKDTAIKWLTAANLVIAALNGFAGYWGFSSAQSIAAFKSDAENSLKTINEIKETVYYYAIREIERDVERIVKELPGLEFNDEKSKALKNNLLAGLKKIETLENGTPQPTKSNKKYLAAGILKFDEKDYDGAIADLKKIQEPIPEKYYLIGAAQLRNGNGDKALQMFLKVRETRQSAGRDPLMAKAHNGEGILYAKRNNVAKAIESYKSAIRCDPDCFSAYYNLAAAYSRIGEYEKTISYLCDFRRKLNVDVVREVDTDPDKGFENLRGGLGADWKIVLGRKLERCR